MSNHKLSVEISNYLIGNWPCSASQIVEGIGLSLDNRSKINLVSYHLKQMNKNGKIRLKKIGRNLVAWPMEIEKIRVLREFMEGML